ncbi:hypothetical protein H6F90_13190 [Trichocoleus sp. FACHB-591]|uniref:hypothetical protein n=1 Tax=Trichocoleus sp. FACHB-591 TaxID=2692872 RepID=UPI0016864E60|nr:hypothetical protein [Trichocoleus sp. FACHB-591]MBD2096097.1 hypothetical protein [Trichocoleus sp. FACHB-591]
MNYLILTSILKKQTYISQFRTSVAALIPVALSVIAATGLNIVYAKRYKNLLAYFENFHPGIYERIRRKPDVGPFYSTGYNYVKPLAELTKQPEIQNDPKAKKMLADFLNFDQKTTWIGIAIGVIGLLMFSVISIIASY